ncbi:MAG: DMT family transporter [Candidatus Njordarchaeales archaeon]
MLGYLYALISALSWSTASILYGYALKERDALTVTLLRIYPAFLTAIIGTILLEKMDFSLLFDPYTLFLAVICGAIGMFFGSYTYLYAIKKTGVSITYPIAFSYPVYVSLITTQLMGEPLTIGLILGLAMLLIGLITLSLSEKESREDHLFLGVLVAFLTSIIWAVNAVIAKIALYRASPILFAMMRLLTLSIATTPLMIKKIKDAKSFTKWELLAATLGGAIGIGIGLIFSHLAIIEIGAARTTVIGSSSPALSLLLAAVFLKEKLNPQKMVGSLAVTIAILLVVFL